MEYATGRYGALFKTLANANNKSNFLAFLLEVTFAHQFETAGMPLAYEVKQVSEQTSSVDFKLAAQTGDAVFFELQLQQQDQPTANHIAEQLAQGLVYAAMKDGDGQTDEIFRLQSTILRKVQKPDGSPVKFLQNGAGIVNIVVVCISDILLETPDAFDCTLTMYGDLEVPEHCRRGVFGLFQDTKAGDTEEFQVRAAKYAHIKGTLHGVLFIFRPNGSGVLDYHLQQVMVWNRNLVSQAQAAPLMKQIAAALPAKV
ncbi:hypothetical protein ACFQAT_05025 [Undibacterium arcticum]|uniref:hypothetical protein n=1 Tax=Undibacterium arcticum TaxID=1762892 RepID=UPI0036070F59